MAAKRLGQALSDLEGTSKQLLRVKADETGFEFTDPASIPEYTISNYDEDRALNASNTTLDELADVVATLIEDLATAGLTGGGGGGLDAFQWSTSEQVWPFEKGPNGETVYAKQINVANLPNTGVSDHAINPSQQISELLYLHFYGGSDSWGWVPGNFPSYWNVYVLGESPPFQSVRIEALTNVSSQSGVIKILYYF